MKFETRSTIDIQGGIEITDYPILTVSNYCFTYLKDGKIFNKSLEGLIDIDNKKVTNEIENEMILNNNNINIVRSTGKYKIYKNKKLLLKRNYDYIKLLSDNRILINKKNHYKIIDENKNVVLDLKDYEIDGFFISSKHHTMVINKNIIITDNYSKVNKMDNCLIDIGSNSIDNDFYIIKNNGKYGIIDYLGNILLDIEYDKISLISGCYYKVVASGVCSIINVENKNSFQVNEKSNIYKNHDYFVVDDKRVLSIDGKELFNFDSLIESINYKYNLYVIRFRDETYMLLKNDNIIIPKIDKYIFIVDDSHIIIDKHLINLNSELFNIREKYLLKISFYEDYYVNFDTKEEMERAIEILKSKEQELVNERKSFNDLQKNKILKYCKDFRK